MPLPVPSFEADFAEPEALGKPRSIILFGAEGTRKTTMAGELIKHPDTEKIMWLDADNGTNTLAADPEIWAAVKDKRIRIMPFNTLDPTSFAKTTQVIQEVAATDFGYTYIVLDTLNVLQEAAVKFLLANTLNSSGVQDTRAGYAQVADWTLTMARMLHNAPHVTPIFIMHERTEETDTGRVKIKPKLAGGARDSIATLPDIVVNLAFEQKLDSANDEDTELIGRIGESADRVSKNRYRLPTKIHDFSLLKLYDVIDSKLDGSFWAANHETEAATAA